MGLRSISRRFRNRIDPMSLHADLLRQARQLAVREPRRPLQASLRRATSASYYALFHLLVDEATNRMLPGVDRASLRGCLARVFHHSDMKRVAQQFSSGGVSPRLSAGLNNLELQPELIGVAAAFVDLQQARHEADYDTARRFTSPTRQHRNGVRTRRLRLPPRQRDETPSHRGTGSGDDRPCPGSLHPAIFSGHEGFG